MGRKDSEEARIVAFAMELIENNPDLNEVLLRESLIKNKKKRKFKKEFEDMAVRSLEHYLYMGRIFTRLKKLLVQEADGTEEWTKDDYKQLLSTGILLCDKVKIIGKLPDKEFLSMLKLISSKLPASKKFLNSYIDNEFSKAAGEFEEIEFDTLHANIRDYSATNFLREMGCLFVSTEVELEKKDETSRGLKIDALGWKKDGTICGIEVKTQLGDDIKTKKDIRLDRYIRYCNEFYILTIDEKIYKSTISWRNNRKYDEMGVILCNKDSMELRAIENPRKIKQEVTDAMLLRIQKAFLTKFVKLVDSIFLDNSVDNPSLAIEKIKSTLSKEFIGF